MDFVCKWIGEEDSVLHHCMKSGLNLFLLVGYVISLNAWSKDFHIWGGNQLFCFLRKEVGLSKSHWEKAIEAVKDF